MTHGHLLRRGLAVEIHQPEVRGRPQPRLGQGRVDHVGQGVAAPPAGDETREVEGEGLHLAGQQGLQRLRGRGPVDEAVAEELPQLGGCAQGGRQPFQVAAHLLGDTALLRRFEEGHGVAPDQLGCLGHREVRP